MIVLGSKRRHAAFWTIVVLLLMTTKLSFCNDLRLTLDCIFSGLLALTGFVFTARTFITFKLNEVIYSDVKYRKHVEALQRDGAYKQKLYEPLRNIDQSLENATYMSLWSVGLFILVAFLPRESEVNIDASHKAKSIMDIMSNSSTRTLVASHLEKLEPFVWKMITDVAMTYFVFCLYQMIVTTRSLHKNIKAIVDYWEKDYEDKKLLH